MCSVAPGMGSGWETNIARLIDQANETLNTSAYSRRGGSPYRGRANAASLGPAPTSFRADRAATYRRGSDGWDPPLLVRRRDFEGTDSSPPPMPPPASFSRLASARVDSARVDGMEDRIKLEVQTVVRRDVSSLTEGRLRKTLDEGRLCYR